MYKIMALPKIEEARNLNDEELATEVLAVKRELFQLRLEQATGRLEKPHLFKHTKHRLAQLLTVERERQLQQPESTTTVSPQTPSTEEE